MITDLTTLGDFITTYLPLILAGIIAVAVIEVGTVFTLAIGDDRQHLGANLAYAAEMRAAAEIPAEFDPGPRRLAPDWRDQVDPPEVPELVRPYAARHRQEDTVDLAALRRVSAGWTPPVGARRCRAQIDDTQQMAPLR